MAGKAEDRPVVVASFLNPNEAHIFRGLLASEGIDSFVYHEHSTMYTPVLIGGVRVAVKGKDLNRARLLLQTIEKEKNT